MSWFKKNSKKTETLIPVVDTIQEQIEAPDTSIFCPESIKSDGIKDVRNNPQNYIEINIIKRIRIVDTFFIKSNIRQFHYKNRPYDIDEEKIYLLPTKSGFFMPTSFYYENNFFSISFKQTNKGITGKAMSLLYDPNLYIDLFSGNEAKYNLFIVMLLIISVSGYFVGLYFLLKDVIGI